MAKLELTKKIEVDGEEISSIEYDFDSLTGKDIKKSTTDLAKRGHGVTMPEFDTYLHAEVFAYASGLDYTDLERLGAKDYIRMLSLVRDFFTSLEELQQKISSTQ